VAAHKWPRNTSLMAGCILRWHQKNCSTCFTDSWHSHTSVVVFFPMTVLKAVKGVPFKSWAYTRRQLWKQTVAGRYLVQTEPRLRSRIGPLRPGNVSSRELTSLFTLALHSLLSTTATGTTILRPLYKVTCV